MVVNVFNLMIIKINECVKFCYFYEFYFISHTVSRILQSKQREPNVKLHSVLHFPQNFRGIAYWMEELNATLLPKYQSVETKILINNNSFTTFTLLLHLRYSHKLEPLPQFKLLKARIIRLTNYSILLHIDTIYW